MHVSFILGIAFKCILALLTTFLLTHIQPIANQKFSALQTSFPRF